MKKLFLSLTILLPIITFGASTEYQLLEPLPCINDTGQVCDKETGTIKNINADAYIAYIFKFSIAFAAVAAVVVIMYSGFEYATSPIVNSKESAKERIQNAIWGLITILASYLILNTIDPRLTQIDTRLEPIDLKGQVFDYNAVVNTATDYKINDDLKNANAQMDLLRSDAKKLREKAESLRRDSWDNDDAATKLEQQAKELEKKANLIGSEAALEAVYDSRRDNSGNILTDQTAPTIEERKNSIVGKSDLQVKKLVADGNIEGAEKIKQDRDFYLAKLDIDALADPERNMISYGIENGSTLVENDIKKAVSKIEKFVVPENITPENKVLLEKYKKDSIEKVKAFSKP